MSVCMICGKELTYNEIGAYKKFVNRSSSEFMCLECLALKLQVPEKVLKNKIEEFRAQGCMLFQ